MNSLMKREKEFSRRMKKISVIVPVYNVEPYIDRCIESIVNQDYTDLEIILIDDGSHDGSGAICDRWAEKDNRIAVIHKANEGLGMARNTGLEVATGDYIAFVDSDDWIDYDMYSTLINKALLYEADIVFCGHHIEYSPGKWKDVRDVEDTKVFNESEIYELSLKFISGMHNEAHTYMMSVWHSIYNKKIIETQFFSEREVVSEDLHFQLSAILKSKRVVCIPEAYYYYALNKNSLSHTFHFNKFHLYQNLSKHIENLYGNSDGKRIAHTFYFYTSLWIIRQIVSHDSIRIKNKKKYLKTIVQDSFWRFASKDFCCSHSYFRCFSTLMRLSVGNMAYYIAWLDYWGVCKKFKFK